MLLLFFGFLLAPPAATACDGLASLTIPRTEIVSAGASVRSGNAFCLVKATARPVEDSEIGIEIWLPAAERWNGKLVGTGNGGYSSRLSYGAMEQALAQGYATAGTDTGHTGEDLKFGVGHPEKIVDWGHRAVHVMTETAKLVVRAYYGRFAARAYFSGCSTGGHQALMEAQRYPADYDGIVAGAPGNNRVRLNTAFLWAWTALNQDAASALPAAKLPVLNRAAVAACDELDGVKDGLIGDPRRCGFDAGSLLCRGGDGDDCLTAGQVAAVRRIYDGARNPRTRESLYPGWAKGSEAGWAGYFVGKTQPVRLEFWRDWVFHDPAWEPRTFDFDRDVEYADAKMSFLVANDANLAGFRARQGKLLMYHGWADPVVPAEDSIRYYERVQKEMGGAAQVSAFFRLFLAPGMGHCTGGTGPNAFDALGALDRWVTRGEAPDRMVASHASAGTVDRTRPLCPYPRVAQWSGKGDPNDEREFRCADPARGR